MAFNFKVGKLDVHVFDTRTDMGKECANKVCETIDQVLKEKDTVNMIFASSPSQSDMIRELLLRDVPWEKINAFHMDEYIGLQTDHEGAFANYLRVNLFSKVPLKSVYYLNGLADPKEECERYADLLRRFPVDIALVGIGENGHLAFNDPYLADFFDPMLVKVNPALDQICRQQQINDNWFSALSDVPSSAITVTMYGLLRAKHIVATVPGDSKRHIVNSCLCRPISSEVPASVLRLHQSADLYLDSASASTLNF